MGGDWEGARRTVTVRAWSDSKSANVATCSSLGTLPRTAGHIYWCRSQDGLRPGLPGRLPGRAPAGRARPLRGQLLPVVADPDERDHPPELPCSGLWPARGPLGGDALNRGSALAGATGERRCVSVGPPRVSGRLRLAVDLRRDALPTTPTRYGVAVTARSAHVAPWLGPVAALGLVFLAAPASYGTPTPRLATASPEAALAKAVAGYQRSVTSPWLNVDGRLTDVAVVEARVAAPSSVEVLEYRAPRWRALLHIALASGSVYLAPGHFTAASKAPPEWLRSFDLAPGRSASRSTSPAPAAGAAW